MTLDEIRELIKLATEAGIAELEVQRGEHRVRIRRSHDALSQEYVIPGAARSAPATTGIGNPAPAAPPASQEQEIEAALDPSLVLVKSPIVGTFYDAPSPGAPPFVKAGDAVNPGQVLCIIESMKLMNEIEAEISGIVVSKLVDNAQPVEYGEALFAVRPS
jgi:acetyl-CoA carboxylase biotin carboxyl carrier protein